MTDFRKVVRSEWPKDRSQRRWGHRIGWCGLSVVVPVRGNLIGEHTDSNDELMLPMAIEPSIQLEEGHGELWQVEGIAGVR